MYETPYRAAATVGGVPGRAGPAGVRGAEYSNLTNWRLGLNHPMTSRDQRVTVRLTPTDRWIVRGSRRVSGLRNVSGDGSGGSVLGALTAYMAVNVPGVRARGQPRPTSPRTRLRGEFGALSRAAQGRTTQLHARATGPSDSASQALSEACREAHIAAVRTLRRAGREKPDGGATPLGAAWALP
jgi:hypothetical protein